MGRVFVSDRIGHERLPPYSDGAGIDGRAHYSWKVVSDLYCSGLKSAGIAVQKIVRPEIYQTEVARSILGASADDFHLAIKPIEHLRPLYGARNIFVCGWEFSEFSNRSHKSNPFFNQLGILEKADSVICWTDFTTNNLIRHGIRQATTLPPPVVVSSPDTSGSMLLADTVDLDTASLPRRVKFRPLSSVLQEFAGATVFTSILNPFDHRKQLPAMLQGFLAALEKNPEMILLIKLIIDNKGTQLANINEILPLHFGFNGASRNVVFLGSALTPAELSSFRQLGKYYLCTSSAEGLNLPLVESMVQGIPPVSTWNTAMGAYLSDETSVRIESGACEMNRPGHALSEFLKVTHYPPIPDEITVGILRAAAKSDESYRALSRNAKELAHRRFGPRVFETGFRNLVARLGGDV